jgi:hypothetical protein
MPIGYRLEAYAFVIEGSRQVLAGRCWQEVDGAVRCCVMLRRPASHHFHVERGGNEKPCFSQPLSIGAPLPSALLLHTLLRGAATA